MARNSLAELVRSAIIGAQDEVPMFYDYDEAKLVQLADLLGQFDEPADKTLKRLEKALKSA